MPLKKARKTFRVGAAHPAACCRHNLHLPVHPGDCLNIGHKAWPRDQAARQPAGMRLLTRMVCSSSHLVELTAFQSSHSQVSDCLCCSLRCLESTSHKSRLHLEHTMAMTAVCTHAGLLLGQRDHPAGHGRAPHRAGDDGRHARLAQVRVAASSHPLLACTVMCGGLTLSAYAPRATCFVLCLAEHTQSARVTSHLKAKVIPVTCETHLC